jgi:hypothetical protein
MQPIIIGVLAVITAILAISLIVLLHQLKQAEQNLKAVHVQYEYTEDTASISKHASDLREIAAIEKRQRLELEHQHHDLTERHNALWSRYEELYAQHTRAVEQLELHLQHEQLRKF